MNPDGKTNDNDSTAVRSPERATQPLPPNQQIVPTEAPPEKAGAYKVGPPVGSGGGGTVYEAQHAMLGRKAAVKILRRELAADTRMVARFIREARAVNMIRHPNIVDIFEFGELPDGRPYYIMELLEGNNLRAMIQSQGRLSPVEALEVLEPVCAAVLAAHEMGVVHRDLKSSNIVVNRTDEGLVVKLLDFGVAKLMQPEVGERGLTTEGTLIGSSLAMSPEQVRCTPVDHRSDIYALGILLYQMLTGSYPFWSDHEPELLRMHLEDPPPRPSNSAPVSPAVDAVVLKSLEKHPDDRYQDVKELLEAFRDAAGAGGAQAPVVETVEALAIYVDARVEGNASDDALMDDLMTIQDIADEIFREAGYDIPLVTGTSVLGTLTLEEDMDRADEGAGAIELAEDIMASIDEREDGDDRIHVNVAAHIGEATANASGDKREVNGGDLLDLASWAPKENVEGLFVSPELDAAAPEED